MRRRRPILRGRLRRRERGNPRAPDEFGEIEPGELSGIFAAPGWLRDLEFSAWLLVGVAAALAGAVWFLSLTQTIVIPVITAAVKISADLARARAKGDEKSEETPPPRPSPGAVAR